jgi:hypothetical protein
VAAASGLPTGEHGSEFCDLGVDVPFLFLEAKDGGGEDFVCQFYRHFVSSE